MAQVRVRWFGVKVERSIKSQANRNLERAAIFLQSQIKRSMKTGGGSPPRHSRPGQIPFVQTGTLRNSIFVRRSDSGGDAAYQTGTNLLYGVAHELGTKRFTVRVKNKKVLADAKNKRFFGRSVSIKLPPRPFIVPAFEKNKNRIARIISTGSQGRGTDR